MLAMDFRTPRSSSQHASSLTTIASMLAPTKGRIKVASEWRWVCLRSRKNRCQGRPIDWIWRLC